METPENPAKDGGREASTLPAMQAPPPRKHEGSDSVTEGTSGEAHPAVFTAPGGAPRSDNPTWSQLLRGPSCRNPATDYLHISFSLCGSFLARPTDARKPPFSQPGKPQRIPVSCSPGAAQRSLCQSLSRSRRKLP